MNKLLEINFFKGCLILPEGSFEIHSASVADAPTARSGDFVIKRTIIHCTTSVGDLLINKCKANIDDGYRPVIITIFERVQTALSQIEDAGLAGRIEVWDIQQFLSSKKNKSTELRLIEIFKGNGITGWKRNYPVKGHPDFVFPEHKIAVFVGGLIMVFKWAAGDYMGVIYPASHQRFMQLSSYGRFCVQRFAGFLWIYCLTKLRYQ